MNLGNRYSQKSFATIPAANISRANFDRSYQRKQTMRMDYLVPIFIDEILPGDTINLSVRTFTRLITQVAPLMDRIYLDYFFFFVPTRLLWDNWEKFNGAQDSPGDSTSYVMPSKVIAQNFSTAQSLYDYFGIPLNATGQTSPTGGQITIKNIVPMRTYPLVWNTWFRDQNLQTPLTLSTADGPDTTTQFGLTGRNRKHDYFMSGLPWPQKGTALSIPLGTSAPVYGTGKAVGFTDGSTSYGTFSHSSAGITVATGMYNQNVGTTPAAGSSPTSGTTVGVVTSGTSGLYADLSTATAATINQLRQAFMVQSLLELDARGGTRYVEILLAHFGVTSPDFRLQRPEYLGGGRETIISHPVPQQSATSGSNYQANLASFGTAQTSDNSIGFTKSFVEHGYVLGLVNARGEMSYQQGLNRMWMRETRYDFFWPKLQLMGEQSVYNGEVFFDNDAAGTNYNTLCYQERYSEYKYRPAEIIGQFRSQYSTPLDQWHLAPKFSSTPTFNTTFLSVNTPIERNLANTTTQAQLLQDLWFDYKHARPMVAYPQPATLGRF